MPVVEANLKQISWPRKCCRCGGDEYSFRRHTDDVVISTVLSVTEYRKISLDIPVCDRCARAHYVWFGAAIAIAAIGSLILFIAGDSDIAVNVVAVAFVLAVVAAIVGVRKRPIKILKFDEKNGTVRVRHGKGDRARPVALDPSAQACVDRWIGRRNRRA